MNTRADLSRGPLVPGLLATTVLLLAGCSSKGPGDAGAARSQSQGPVVNPEAHGAVHDGRQPASSSGALADLRRPLHFPGLDAGKCPTSRGRYMATPEIAGVALGAGPVRVFVGNSGHLRAGSAHLAPVGRSGWFALKTHFVSSSAYRGPLLVRAKRLDRVGEIALGARPPHDAPLVASSASAANEAGGWRDFPYPTYVRSSGCYAWQLDGRTFSHVVVVHAVTPGAR